MSRRPVLLQPSRGRRGVLEAQPRRARRWRIVRSGLLASLLGLAILLALMAPQASEPGSKAVRAGGSVAAMRKPSARSGYAISLARRRVRPRFKLPVRSGLLFDVRSGRVLWERDPGRPLPIASLTKMMTALVVAARARPFDRALVTRAAIDYSGSGVGLLPLGKRVPVEALLYGLLLPSGNDAAIALAQHVAGTQGHFVAMMNVRARNMGLRCTHFTSASGLADQGNQSCAVDLAIVAHAVLQRALLARIVGSASAVLPFPIKGGKLYLYNNNPLLRLGYRGADGVKTGYTVAAGRCLVATARRRGRWLGVVLLHSADPPQQARELLDAGFATRAA